MLVAVDSYKYEIQIMNKQLAICTNFVSWNKLFTETYSAFLEIYSDSLEILGYL